MAVLSTIPCEVFAQAFSKRLAAGGTHLPRVSFASPPINQNLKLRQAKEEHGKSTECDTDPLLEGQLFTEADNRGKSCKHEVTSVNHREEEGGVKNTREIEIKLVVDRGDYRK